MGGLHSRLPPSGSADWVPCPAWVQIGERFPALAIDPSAAEGEAAHWVAEQRWQGTEPEENSRAPNGELVTDEMLQGAEVHNRAVTDALAGWPPELAVIEKFKAIPNLHPAMAGTCDASVNLWPMGGPFHKLDYKFGHLEVDPFENLQLACYLAGDLFELGYRLDDPNIQNLPVVFTVIQPRAFHSAGPVRSWRTTIAAIRPLWDRIQRAAILALSENPPYAVGPQCTYCSGRRACPALRRNAGAAMDYPAIDRPAELDGTALGIELRNARRALALLSSRVDALSEQAEVACRRGESVLFHGLERNRGAKVWAQPTEQVIALGRLLGADLAKPQAPVTPTQAKEIFRKSNLDPAVIDGYSETRPGALKLAQIEDSAAAKVFTQ